MKTFWKDEHTTYRKKIWTALKIIIILFCTAVGGYGILHAPGSDRTELEQELTQKEKQLEQELEAEAPDEQSRDELPGEKQESESQDTPSPSPASEDFLTVIGDSVFLGAAPSFQKLEKNAVIDAKISRQVCQALDVARKLDKKKKLGNTVIISLGINGKFNPATGQALIDYLGPDRRIYWVNAFGKEKKIQKEVNQTIRELADRNSNVTVIAWADEAAGHADWFYQDGTHLNEKGQPRFAEFIKKALE